MSNSYSHLVRATAQTAKSPLASTTQLDDGFTERHGELLAAILRSPELNSLMRDVGDSFSMFDQPFGKGHKDKFKHLPTIESGLKKMEEMLFECCKKLEAQRRKTDVLEERSRELLEAIDRKKLIGDDDYRTEWLIEEFRREVMLLKDRNGIPERHGKRLATFLVMDDFNKALSELHDIQGKPLGRIPKPQLRNLSKTLSSLGKEFHFLSLAMLEDIEKFRSVSDSVVDQKALTDQKSTSDDLKERCYKIQHLVDKYEQAQSRQAAEQLLEEMERLKRKL